MTKKYFLFACIGSAAIFAGCNNGRCCDNIVRERYVHKYGVEVAERDWTQRGQHGQVISTQKDGVTVTKTYEGGVLCGDVTYTFPHSQNIERRQNYQEGGLASDAFYYKSGGQKQEMRYIGPNHIIVNTWYMSGEPKSREEYQNESLVQGEYFGKDHAAESHIDSGNGLRITRDEYGQLISKDKFVDGQLVQVTTYYNDGTPREIVPLNRGLTDGRKQFFNPDGTPLRTEEWEMGQLQGNITLYENGEVTAKIPYQQGIKEGLEERFGNEKLVGRINWKNGQRHGMSQTYVGDVASSEWYYQDKPVNKGQYDRLTIYSIQQ